MPDLVYVSLTFHDRIIPELYGVRRETRHIISFQRMFMEDLALLIHKRWPMADVTVRLAFNRHVVSIKGDGM